MKTLKKLSIILIFFGILFGAICQANAAGLSGRREYLVDGEKGGACRVGAIVTIDFTNGVYSGNPTNTFEIFYSQDVFKCVESTIPDASCEAINGGVKVEVEDNYSGQIKFEVLELPTSPDKQKITINIIDNGETMPMEFSVCPETGSNNTSSEAEIPYKQDCEGGVCGEEVDSTGVTVDTAGEKSEELPKGGPEHILLIFVALLLGVGIFGIARKKSY